MVPKAFQINIKLAFQGTKNDKEQIHKWWRAEKEAGGEGGRQRRSQAEKEAGEEGGRQRRKQAEKDLGGIGGRSLITNNRHQKNEELITRMENNLQQVKNELQNGLRNHSLGDTDKHLWTLFALKTLEQLELNTEARVAEREKRKTLTLTPTGSSKDHTNNGTSKGKNN